MIVCPNCGSRNEPGSRFCSECGADLRALDAASQPASSIPPPPPTTAPPPLPSRPSDLPPTAPEWRMSDAGPLPESKRRRRTWLWILVGIVLAILLCCCAAIIWASTIGEDTVNDWTTRIARELTETAGTEEVGE